ncbi:DUF721 domain-containing protein [Ornithinimicrobium cavernae]|uniref:DUF721 domain-containing protein n=1 Tax=Ornithinimicrobium cavernae TaxID=2666047 RepID=UPI000D686B95|nr:DciA family protein [Ornithinimicrobium cavernae]
MSSTEDPRSPDGDAGQETSAAETPPLAGETPPLAAAADALARARANARSRGLRPGQVDRRRTAGDALAERRSGTGAGAARDPRLLDTEVDRLVSSRGWSTDVQVGAVIGRWATIVGAEVAQHVRPLGFDGTVLTVQADSTAWATQMRLLTHSVLTRIEAEVGEGAVTEITVRGPAAPSWRKGRLRAQGRGPRDTYG